MYMYYVNYINGVHGYEVACGWQREKRICNSAPNARVWTRAKVEWMGKRKRELHTHINTLCICMCYACDTLRVLDQSLNCACKQQTWQKWKFIFSFRSHRHCGSAWVCVCVCVHGGAHHIAIASIECELFCVHSTGWFPIRWWYKMRTMPLCQPNA